MPRDPWTARCSHTVREHCVVQRFRRISGSLFRYRFSHTRASRKWDRVCPAVPQTRTTSMHPAAFSGFVRPERFECQEEVPRHGCSSAPWVPCRLPPGLSPAAMGYLIPGYWPRLTARGWTETGARLTARGRRHETSRGLTRQRRRTSPFHSYHKYTVSFVNQKPPSCRLNSCDVNETRQDCNESVKLTSQFRTPCVKTEHPIR